MWTWHFSYIKDIATNLFPEIASKTLDVFNDGMGTGDWSWSIDKIIKRFQFSDILGLLKDKRGEVGSYFFATLPNQKLFEKNLLWIDACSVRKTLQKKGYFKKGIKIIKNTFKSFDFGFIGGRSQNPAVFMAFDNISSGNDFYPFEKKYSREIMDYLKSNIIDEIKIPSEEKGRGLNEINGIISNAYWGKRLGDYVIDMNHKRIEFFENKLTEWGFNRENGDAIIILKRIK